MGWTCLMYACNNARIEIIQYLLDCGADPKYSHANYTCLMIIANNYDADENCANCLKLLIKAGADVNHKDEHGSTAFMMSIKSNKINCASTLLEYNADPNISQKDGTTALTIAVQKQNLEMVKLLLNMKGDFKLGSADKEKAHRLAKTLKMFKIANLLSPEKLLAEDPLQKPKLDNIDIGVKNFESNDICTVSISDFDLFLIANDIQHLRPIFEKYSIDGTSFYTLTKDEFIKMDIREPHLVTKLMTIISKINCISARNSSKIIKAYKNFTADDQEISCCECVDIMRSTKEHFAFALSCVSIVHDDYSHKKLLTAEMDVEHLKSLDYHLDECIANVLHFENDLSKVQFQLLEIYGDNLPKLPPLNKILDHKEKSNSNILRRTFALTFITASASFVLIYLFKRK